VDSGIKEAEHLQYHSDPEPSALRAINGSVLEIKILA
jgi:hypothetical protein